MKTGNIFRKIFIPISVMVVGMLAVFFVLEYLCSLSELKKNSISLFEESVSARRDFLETKMTGQWSEIINSAEKVTGEIEAVLKEENASTAWVSFDGRLNQKVMERVAGTMVEAVKWYGTTDGFIILNGPSAANDKKKVAAVYVVNDAPGRYDSSNSSIQYERGVSTISKQMQIPLASNWEADMVLDRDKDDFFFVPYESALKDGGDDPAAYGFWSLKDAMNGQNKKVVVYSVPLILSDGTVAGVMGIGINETCLVQNIQMEQGGHALKRSYMLALKNADGSLTEVAFSGQGEGSKSLETQNFIMEDGKAKLTAGEDRMYTDTRELLLYSPNTPVKTNQWYLVGIEKEADVFETYYRSMLVQFMLIALAMICCFGMAIVVGKHLSDPIRRMMTELRASDPNRAIHLHKTYIAEMDELADSIGYLSDRVAKANSKLSQIIHMSDARISVFEYRQSENMIYVSPEFCSMIGWNDLDSDSITAETFKERMVFKFGDDAFIKEHIFEIPGSDGDSCWMRLTQKQEDDILLGVLVDITREIKEKMRVEYERDNDSLTGLMNRRAFERNMEELFEQKDTFQSGMFLAWDLDNLKHFNDTYGHNTGDDYIISLAECLKKNNSDHVMSARRSGDEFVSFVFANGRDEVMEYVEKLWEDAKNTRFRLPDGRERNIQISMGMAWYPEHADNPKKLAAFADFALYQVKHGTKGTKAVFTPELYREEFAER